MRSVFYLSNQKIITKKIERKVKTNRILTLFNGSKNKINENRSLEIKVQTSSKTGKQLEVIYLNLYYEI